MEWQAVFETERQWVRQRGADPKAIAELRSRTPAKLPEELYSFLAISNGGAGRLAIQPGWFELWRAEDLLSLNQVYAVDQQWPGYFGFGTNGGGELLAFELSNDDCGKVAMVAFIGGEPIVISDSFAEFVTHIGKSSEL